MGKKKRRRNSNGSKLNDHKLPKVGETSEVEESTDQNDVKGETRAQHLDKRDAPKEAEVTSEADDKSSETTEKIDKDNDVDEVVDKDDDQANDSEGKAKKSSKSRKRLYRGKGKGANIFGSAVWIIIILAICSLAYYMMQREDFGTKTDNTTTTQVSKSSKANESKTKASVAAKAKADAESAKKAKEESQKQADAKKASEDQANKDNQNNNQNNQNQDQGNNQAQDQTQNNTQPAAQPDNQAGYATVQSGQGLYRVAVNNGISLQELLQLNGLNSASDIAPGQRLRVK